MLSCILKVLLPFLAISRIKWFKLGLFGTKHGTQHYLVYVIVLKWLATKNLNICLKLRGKLHFKGFLAFLALSRIKWFKHGLFDTNLGIQNYLAYVILLKIVRISINSHMLEITC